MDAVQSEVAGGGSPGPRIVEDAFGAKQSARVREVATAGGEARAWAKAEMLRRSRRFVTLDGVTSGTSDLTVGSHVRVERVAATFRRRAVLRDVGAPLLRRHRRVPHPLPGRTSDVGGAMRPAFGHESAVNDGSRSRLFGVYPAVVSDIVDPDARGRVKVRFPWLPDDGGSVGSWAVLLSPYADDEQGLQTIPEVGSMVVVAFEAGDINRPYILGAAWNGQATLPVAVEAANNKRLVKSRAGSRLEFDDTAGSPKVAITVAGDSSGAVHKIVLDDAGDSMLIKSRNGALVEIAAGGRDQHHRQHQGDGHRADGAGRRADGAVLGRRQVRDADRDDGRRHELHARSREHLVSVAAPHRWRLVAPWYRWDRRADARSDRAPTAGAAPGDPEVHHRHVHGPVPVRPAGERSFHRRRSRPPHRQPADTARLHHRSECEQDPPVREASRR